jgi:cold shock CspA family protein
MYQVTWFSKKKGYGFVEDSSNKQYFVHHSDICVSDGFRYLKQGEYVLGVPETMEEGKVKLGQIKAPMENGNLMCQIDKLNRENRRQVSSGDNDAEE